MKIEDLTKLGMSEEDAKKIIAQMESEQKAAVNAAVTDATKDQLSEEKIKELEKKAKIADAFAKADLNDAQQATKIIAEAQQAKADYEELTRKNTIEMNRVKAKAELEKAGVPEDKMEDILSCVTDNEENSMKIINAMIGSFGVIRENTEKEIRKSDLGRGQGSGDGSGNPGGEEKTEQQKIVADIIGSAPTEPSDTNPYVH